MRNHHSYTKQIHIQLLSNTLAKVLLVACMCLCASMNAQQKPTTVRQPSGTMHDTLDYRMTRVPDPLSKTTVWIDSYITHSNTLTKGTQPDGADVVLFRFRVNSIVFEPSYMDNAQSLALLHRIFADTSQYKTRLTLITGSASPEGYPAENKLLAANRALAIKAYITKTYPNADRDKLSTYSIGEDWVGLRQMVQKDKKVPAKKQILAILNLPISDLKKLQKLKDLNRGEAYAYLAKAILPQLRGGVTCTFYTLEAPKELPAPTIEYRDRVVETLRIDTVYIERNPTLPQVQNPSMPTIPLLPSVGDVGEALPKAKKPFYLVVKNNLLYDAALLPNLAVEYSISKHWSLELEGMESWWNTKDSSPYKHRIQSLGLEARRWWGNKYEAPLLGHFVGLYGMGGTYDIKNQKEKGSLSNWSYSAGITYGYALPLARRLNLEFAIGMGYIGGHYKSYTYDRQRECYTTIKPFNRSYWGPTKAKISIVWLIGSGFNINTKR